MKKTHYLLFIISMLALQACTTSNTNRKPTNASVKIMPAADNRLTTLLDFYDTYSNLSLDAQKKAFYESNQALLINKNDLIHRIKMATMLVTPTSQLKDLPKAQSLLQDLMQDTNIPKLEMAYIGLLYEFTLDNQKLLLKSRDDLKKQNLNLQKYETLQQKNEILLQKNEALQQKNENLEQKLLELKNIEKSLSERDIRPLDKVLDKSKP